MTMSLSERLFHSLPPRPIMTDRRCRADINPAPNCPRCASTNTKFCYYNNYSLSQPRFICKGCRRYWTKGGSLRNVPVGGGCRKSRRSRASRGFSSTISGTRSDSSTSPKSSSGCSGSDCPDIDLAAVFAKFLNPVQDNGNKEINDATTKTTNPCSETSYDSPISTSSGLENRFEYQILSADHTQVNQEGFICPDFASFDDIIDDDFWLEDSNFSDWIWQPADQFQEFDSSMLPAEESKSSTNLFSSDNCSYFDSTGFEAFSEP